MYCEICHFQQKPERRDLLIRHMETSEMNCREGKIVWRENQLWVTTKPKKNETQFDWEVPNNEPAPEPDELVLRNYKPNVVPGGIINE